MQYILLALFILLIPTILSILAGPVGTFLSITIALIGLYIHRNWN